MNKDTHAETTHGQPRTEGGATAPQEVQNPGERTTPAASGDEDRSRIENAAEDRERTLPK